MTDLKNIKARQQQAWAAGNYAMTGSRLVVASELLCESLDLRAGQQVLDVATGHGNTALAAARRGCEVTGIDYIPAWLEQGRERAVAERLEVTFCEGDAENIPFPEETFDVVVSTFGAMFAPDQEQTASELLRVCRSGGKIGMANWIPAGFIKEFFQTIAKHVPPPPGVKSPLLWGTEERLAALFGNGIVSLQVTPQCFANRYRSVEEFVEFFRKYYGPLMKAFAALNSDGQDRLAHDLSEVARRFNQSGDETLVGLMDYIEVLAIKR